MTSNLPITSILERIQREREIRAKAYSELWIPGAHQDEWLKYAEGNLEFICHAANNFNQLLSDFETAVRALANVKIGDENLGRLDQVDETTLRMILRHTTLFINEALERIAGRK